MTGIKTVSEFKLLPIGQKFIESCCSGVTFSKVLKVSENEIKALHIDATTFEAFIEVVEFNPEFHWIKPVNEFESADGKVESFEELESLFIN